MKIGLLLLLISPSIVAAADKDWFCAQRLVDKISTGAVWRGGYHQVFDDFNNNLIVVSAPIKKSAQKLLGSQNQNKEQMHAIIKQFSTQTGVDNIQLTLLFAYTLKQLNQQRQDKIQHILDYSRNHQMRISTLAKTREQIRTAIKSGQKQRLQDLEEQYQWQTRVFNTRKKHNPYLCQKVVDIDAYAFALSKAINPYLVK